MARTRLFGSVKESSFRELTTEDLIINLWNLTYFKCHRKKCYSCNANRYLTIKIIKEWWWNEWGKVDYVLEQIQNCNEQFIDLNYLKKHKRESTLSELEFIQKNF